MITVLSLEEAKKQAKNFDLVISLLDPKLKHGFVKFHPNQHIWWVKDVEQSFDNDAPTKRDMEEIINVFLPYKDKNVLIHCLAGISRSPAVAIGLKVKVEDSPEEAFLDTYNKRPCMWPNSLILHLFDEIMALNGQLESFDLEWKMHHSQPTWRC